MESTALCLAAIGVQQYVYWCSIAMNSNSSREIGLLFILESTPTVFFYQAYWKTKGVVHVHYADKNIIESIISAIGHRYIFLGEYQNLIVGNEILKKNRF